MCRGSSEPRAGVISAKAQYITAERYLITLCPSVGRVLVHEKPSHGAGAQNLYVGGGECGGKWTATP